MKLFISAVVIFASFSCMKKIEENSEAAEEKKHLMKGPFIHEYAHALFEANATAALGEIYNFANDLRNDKLALRLQFDKKIEEKSKMLSSIYKVLLPFNELFADTTAVIYLQDPQAISAYLIACYGIDDPADARDFSIDYPINGWNHGSLDSSLEAHTVLNPARSYIGKILKENMDQNPQFGALVLKAMLDTTFALVKDLYKEGQLTRGNWQAMTIESLNRIYILGLESRLHTLSTQQ